MSDKQSVLDDLTQGVVGSSPDANRERLRRAEEAVRRSNERVDEVYRSWRGLDDPAPRESAVASLLVAHEGSMAGTVVDPAFLAALREDIGTQPYYVEETAIDGGEETLPAHVHDPLDGERAEVERTLAALNEAQEHVGLPPTSARGLLLLAGVEQSQNAQYARDQIEQVGRGIGLDVDASRVGITSSSSTLENALLVLTANDASVRMLTSPEGVTFEGLDERGVSHIDLETNQAARRLGVEPEKLEELSVEVSRALLIGSEDIREEATGDEPVAQPSWTLPASQEAIRVPVPAAPARAVGDERQEFDERSLKVFLDGPDDPQPRFVGVDTDGSAYPMADVRDRAAWMGLARLAEEELEAELLSTAAAEAVWAAPGDRVSATSAELSDEAWDTIKAVAPPETRPSLPPELAAAAAKDVRVDLTPLRERLQSAQANAANSLDAVGVGHPSYGTNVRPDHPQPGNTPTQHQA